MAPVCTRSRMKLQKVLNEDRKQKKAKEISAFKCVSTSVITSSFSSVENTEPEAKVEEKVICSSSSSSSSGCCTPKAKRFRIPEMLTCPPAPKKRKVNPSEACLSINRSPIALFSSPDIELFFFSALKNVSV
ncbi:cyclin-dependent protein kinase inhibitor SMR9 [Trifolium repens]|nr:cyclin-dependent protein kinase inhibitor SMR9 [Trifolium repens]